MVKALRITSIATNASFDFTAPEALIARAEAGDVVAAKELFDRSWGKSLQSTEISGKDGKPAVVFMPAVLLQKYSIGTNRNVQEFPRISDQQSY